MKPSVDAVAMALPAPHVARDCALRLCYAIDHARARLDDPSDTEALHDFRVALRRLRSWVRAYDALLPLTKKQKRALKRLQRLTGPARDAEVGLQYLRSWRAALSESQAVGADWLIARLEEREREGYEVVLAGAPQRWSKLRKTLVVRLTLPPGHTGVGSTFRETAGQAVERYAAELVDALVDAEDATGLHAARIAGKRLRYVLEPLRNACGEAKRIVAELKALQDDLGVLNDYEVLTETLRAEVREAAAERAAEVLELCLDTGVDWERLRAQRGRDPTPGLFALARNLAAQRDALTARVRDCMAAGVPDFVEDARSFGRELGVGESSAPEAQVNG